MDWKEDLAARFKERCFLNKPLAPETTFEIGGAAESLVFPVCDEEWAWLRSFVRRQGLPLTVLGLGSNVIVSDCGLPGVVASSRRMACLDNFGKRIHAQAGAALDAVAAKAVDLGLSGLERLSGIPGSVGGALKINAGAFEAEIYDQLLAFTALDEDGRVVQRAKNEVRPGYRKVDGADGLIFLGADWALEAGDPGLLREIRATTLAARADKQPLDYPSAGSVFKRPPGDFASRLIDACGLKGLSVGRAQVSGKHAGFIINLGGATAKDVMELIAKVREIVREKTGVFLELEQIPLGVFKEAR